MENKQIFLEYKTLTRMKICKDKRYNYLQIKGKHLLIICILKFYNKPLKTSEIIRILSNQTNTILSKTTLNRTLNTLVENKYINMKEGNRGLREQNLYYINNCKYIKKNIIYINYSIL